MWKSIGCPGQSRTFLSRKERIKLRSIGELALRSRRAVAYAQSVNSQCDLDAGRRSDIRNCTANRKGGARAQDEGLGPILYLRGDNSRRTRIENQITLTGSD
jgi:hypothetical protein